MMSERDFARLRSAASADHPRIRDGVVRAAERPRGEERFAGGHAPHGGVDSRGFEAFIWCQRRENRGQAPREHGLATSRGPKHQQVMRAGGSDHDGAFGAFLPADIGEVHIVLVQLLFDLVHAG